MSESGPSSGSVKKRSGLPCGCHVFLLVLVILILAGIALGPISPSPKMARESASLQQARAIELAMFSYANDNQGKYPDGKSSTEVFQQLLDGQYISDPSMLYVPYPGKIKADPDQKKLKPENVSFDVTCCVDGSAPDSLPLVFITGYKVSYVPGGAAVQLPLSKESTRTWSAWFSSSSSNENVASAGMAVANKGNTARFMALPPTSNGIPSISNFIPSDCPLNGKTYRQLTPDGPMAP